MNNEYYGDIDGNGGDKKKISVEKKLAELREKRDKHKGEWITFEDAREYRDRVEKLPDNGFQDIGERRELRKELQERFGLTEGEAINIINGYNMRDIIQVYDNIKNLRVPEQENVVVVYRSAPKLDTDYEFERYERNED
jgi:hypothetical protein